MNNNTAPIDHQEADAGSGASRQSKKLQLRKAGFKAKDMPRRNMTPRKSDSWTRANISATLTPKRSPSRESDIKTAVSELTSTTGVLREISNSSRRRKKQARVKVDEVFVFQDENAVPSPKAVPVELETVQEDSPRCATPGSQPRLRNPSKATPVSRLRKQSVSIDTVKYIEHLESELVAMQTQLTAMTSPTVLQVRSTKMRALNSETRALQDELSEWENKFHERVQDEIEERTRIENGLKARIRLLEGDAEDYTHKIKDMQGQIDRSVVTINASETANYELEKRIDAISNLVTSPKKREFERAEESARKRHSRQKSCLPRFPTTGSLQLPLRVNENAPMTPSTTMPNLTSTFGSSQSRTENTLSLDVNKEALDALTGGSIDKQHSPIDPPSSSNSSKRFSWATPECYTSLDGVAASTGRPSRRMRRFHAGSVMPKPLLLPSTASYAYAVPQSAPVMEKEQTPPSFPFPDLPNLVNLPATHNFDFLLSPAPGAGRRRALTSIEDVAAAMRRTSNPFISPLPFPAAMAKSTKTSTTDSADSDRTIADMSSFGPPPVGRNLFDELRQAKAANPSETDETLTLQWTESSASRATERPTLGSPWNSTTRNVGLRKRAWTSHQRTFSDQTGTSLQCSTLRRLVSSHLDADDEEDVEEIPRRDGEGEGAEEEQGFASLFAAVWRQTYDTARQCMMHAQNVTLRSQTVQRLQWWLVQLLLGPMVTRRMMARSMRGERRRRVTALENAGRDGERRRGGRTARGSRSRTVRGREVWVEGLGGERMQVVRRSGIGQLARISWIGRHSLGLWIRFSLALLFAIGAALRDGPGVVMGVDEEEDRID